MKIVNKLALLATAALIVVSLTACSDMETTGTQKDQRTTNTQLQTYQKIQPIPMNVWSQQRQTLIDVEQAEVHTVATTTFFFNMGATAPYKVCPSIGFPVASTTELSSPDQVVYENASRGGNSVVSQQESTGVYPGVSAGTFVVCVSPKGQHFIVYAEPNTHTEGGAAHWDKNQQLIVDDGDPTVITSATATSK